MSLDNNEKNGRRRVKGSEESGQSTERLDDREGSGGGWRKEETYERIRQREAHILKEHIGERHDDPPRAPKQRQKITVPSKSPDVFAFMTPLLAPREDMGRSSSVESQESQSSPSKHLA